MTSKILQLKFESSLFLNSTLFASLIQHWEVLLYILYTLS